MGTERIGPESTGPEREMLRGFLDFHRATLAMKCDGLSDAELRTRSSPPSTLTLLGLVRHLAESERRTFRVLLLTLRNGKPAVIGVEDTITTEQVAQVFKDKNVPELRVT